VYYGLSSQEIDANFGLITDYQSIGPFYPNDNPPNSSKKHIPYSVNLSLMESNKKLRQLYVSGPGFFSEVNQPKTKVVAAYADCKSYRFQYLTKDITINNLPAMICREPDEKTGGIFLSGTHIETCVPNSKMLNAFASGDKDCAALTKEDYDQLVAEQTETRVKVESTLSRAFMLRSM
jgi:glutamine amidotransferase-like uncharacterized protein